MKCHSRQNVLIPIARYMCIVSFMKPLEDIEDLIFRVALGERLAFEQLYQKTSGKLFGICLRILNNRNDAEDAMQEVFIKIWNKADGFAKGRASGIAWLCAIARNQAIDHYRRRKPATDDITERHDIADNRPSPEAEALTSDGNRRLAGCLDELNEKHSRAIKRTYLGGWTYQQAADELAIPLNTAKTWIRRSLSVLRECMDR